MVKFALTDDDRPMLMTELPACRGQPRRARPRPRPAGDRRRPPARGDRPGGGRPRRVARLDRIGRRATARSWMPTRPTCNRSCRPGRLRHRCVHGAACCRGSSAGAGEGPRVRAASLAAVGLITALLGVRSRRPGTGSRRRIPAGDGCDLHRPARRSPGRSHDPRRLSQHDPEPARTVQRVPGHRPGHPDRRQRGSRHGTRRGVLKVTSASQRRDGRHRAAAQPLRYRKAAHFTLRYSCRTGKPRRADPAVDRQFPVGALGRAARSRSAAGRLRGAGRREPAVCRTVR